MNQRNTVKLVVMEGDGIGPEIVASAVSILQAASRKSKLKFIFDEVDIGFKALRETGSTFPAGVAQRVKDSDGAILGPVSHNDYPPVGNGGLNPSGELRKHLDLYANIRPACSLPGLARTGYKPMNLVIVRENTEGSYSDRAMFQGAGEFMPSPDMALSIRKITRNASLRIADVAFKLARKRRLQVTAVHKANVLRTSDGLFLECIRNVASRYSDVAYNEQLVDAMAALLIRDPSVFDVIVTANMYGDILSDEASEIAGGLGLAGSLNAGDDMAIAQAQHGSAPSLEGRDIANPCSIIKSTTMLLQWLGEQRGDTELMSMAAAIDKAINDLIASQIGTKDIGGKLGTRAFTQRVIDAMASAC